LTFPPSLLLPISVGDLFREASSKEIRRPGDSITRFRRKNLQRSRAFSRSGSSRGRPRKTSHGARATVSKSMRERRGDPRAPSRQCGRHHRQRPPLLPPPRAAALLPLFGNLSSDSVQLSSVAPLGRVVRVPRKLRERPAVRATPKQPLSLSLSPSFSLDSYSSVTPTPFPFSHSLCFSLFLRCSPLFSLEEYSCGEPDATERERP